MQQLLFLLGVLFISIPAQITAQEDPSEQLLALEDKILLGEEESPFNLEDLKKARALVDKAVTDNKTQMDPRSWYLRACVYGRICLSEYSISGLTKRNAAAEAKLAFLKVNQIAPEDSNYYVLAEMESEDLYELIITDGISNFNAKKPAVALQYFEYLQILKPKDTLGYQYGTLAAVQSENYPEALRNYQELVKIRPDIESYEMIITIQNTFLNDYQGAYQSIQEAKEKLGKVSDKIVEMEIDLLLATNRMEEALRSLEDIVYKDPANSFLWLKKGAVCEELINKENKRVKPDESKLKAWKSKALNAYAKTIEIEKDNKYAYDAYFGSARLLNNEAVIYYNEAYSLDAGKNASRIAELEQKADKLMREALPLMEKALEIWPESKDALVALSGFYKKMEMPEKVKEVEEKYRQLSKQ